ncbi:fusaric acid resistance family protein [Marinomonas alcarazii]|uniref:Fusaric acid resistance family protein n=1 Tax=Marinomonas alcarazii TaxID=491949 RepID=A0A318V677_9GAMM|nr:FUSC family protein [Marinomonas alcarazii]PYF83523.1 fusaric acid resistance family protein [Marinomonas alcarazii]
MFNALLTQLKELFAWSDIKRPWHLAVLAAVCVGVPVLIGAALDQFAVATLSSLGAMVILYLPKTRTAHRMVTLAMCSFGFMICFSIGSLSSFNHYVAALALGLLSFGSIVITRYYRLPPPGSFFFILVSALAIYLPFDLGRWSSNIGMVALGGMLSCCLAFFYSLMTGANDLPVTKIETDPRVNAIILEAALVAFFIALSYLIAVIFELENALWVPISCAAILQGATYRMIWHRNIHRIVGTALGMGVAYSLFSFQPNYWVLALSMIFFQFVVELLIVKNYGAAVIFITPLTVIMAEITSANISTEVLLEHRLVDISIGSAIGILGGTIFHRTSLLKHIESRMNTRSSLSGRKPS